MTRTLVAIQSIPLQGHAVNVTAKLWVSRIFGQNFDFKPQLKLSLRTITHQQVKNLEIGLETSPQSITITEDDTTEITFNPKVQDSEILDAFACNKFDIDRCTENKDRGCFWKETSRGNFCWGDKSPF